MLSADKENITITIFHYFSKQWSEIIKMTYICTKRRLNISEKSKRSCSIVQRKIIETIHNQWSTNGIITHCHRRMQKQDQLTWLGIHYRKQQKTCYRVYGVKTEGQEQRYVASLDKKRNWQKNWCYCSRNNTTDSFLSLFR